MSARLYAGADPVDLVPGSLEALHADADDLDAAAARLGAAGRDIEHQVIASWFGLAAEGWPTRRTSLVAVADGLADVYALAAQVLRAHADAVVWARLQAQVAVELWEEADRQSFMTADVCLSPTRPRALADAPRLGSRPGAALATTRTVAPPDPGAGARELARQVLEGALRDVSRSATAAAEVLDALSEGLPDGRWHPGEFLVGVWSWLYGIGSLVARFSYIRATLDREGWYADAEAMRQDLLVTAEFLAANPDEAGPVLLDSQGLRDSPARWWGAMAPDLALSVAGGVGVASRLKTVLWRPPRTPPGPPAVVPPGPPALTPPGPVPRVFTSTDAHVPEAVAAIEAAMPGRVVSVNTLVQMTDGLKREVDIDLGSVVVQVKSGRARELTGQMMATSATTDRVVVGYAPDMKHGAWVNATRVLGLRIARTTDELVLILQELE